MPCGGIDDTAETLKRCIRARAKLAKLGIHPLSNKGMELFQRYMRKR